MNELSTVPEALLYQAIAQSIVDAIDEPWSSASAMVVIENEVTGLIAGQYATKDSTAQDHDLRLDSQCYALFEELARRAKQSENPWNVAQFHLYPDARFEFQVAMVALAA